MNLKATGELPAIGQQREKGLALVELVMVVAIALIVIAMAVPTVVQTTRNYRALGDARDVASEVLLAKMRAASDFTQARVRFNLAANNGYAANSFQIEIWDKTGASAACAGTACWYIDAPSGTINLSTGVSMGYGAQTHQPNGTQSALGQGNSTAADASCYPGASGGAPGSAIANTACIVFNSRGIPVDHTGSATADDAVYINDGRGVYATTINAAGLTQNWRIDINNTTAANWNQR